MTNKGLMKGLIKTGVVFSAALIAVLALLYVLPAAADSAITSSSVSPASVNTRQNVTLNFTMTHTGAEPLINISVNFSASGFTGLVVGNIVCPNSSATTRWNASIVNADLATCFKNHSAQNLSGTFNIAFKGVSAPKAGQVANFTFNVTDNSTTVRTNSTTVSVTVRLLEANASVDVSSVNAGAKQNYTFTIRNNGTDSIDRINITYDANFADPAAGDVVCPTTDALWNRSVDSAVNSIVCLLPDPSATSIIAGGSATLKVENWSAPNDARRKTFDVSVRGLNGSGNFTLSANKPFTDVYGNLSITGTSRVAATTQIGSTNVTIISFNFSATGEQMNVTGINVTINGTGITTADIVRVALYNTTRENLGTYNETENITLIGVWNNSAPVAGVGNTLRYNFSNIVLNVNTSQIVMIVVNLSSTATGGRTFNASIEGAADVTTVGGHSGQSITETFATQRSGSSTIYGTLTVTGTNRINATTQIGTGRVTLISYNFSAAGEAMNVSELVLTVNGTSINTTDIQSITLYNSTDPSTTIVNGSQTLLMTNVSTIGKVDQISFNFSLLNLSVPTGATGQIVLVVVNVSSGATAGHSINGTILGNTGIVTTSAVSAQSIAETVTTPASSSTIITGTLAVTGTSRIAATTQIGSKNVTIISFLFNATGEQMNITGINMTLNGTLAFTDVRAIGLYNSTAPNAGVYNESTYGLIQWNISEPVSAGGNTLRYNFSNIVFNVPTGTPNTLVVVINLTDTAIGGHTFNASIEGAADVVTTGGGSAQSITETFTSQRSITSTIYGNLSVTGTNIAPPAADTGQIGIGLLRLTLNSTGEMINVTSFNITSNSTSNTDVLAVKLYSDSGGATTGTYERGSDLPIAGASGVFTGSSVILTPTTSIQVENNTLSYVYVVVDVNTSATVGLDRLGASIQGAGAITALGNDSFVSLTPQLITGDPVDVADIKNLTAAATVITAGSALATTSVGTLNNFTFTINNTGTGALIDSIDEIRILYGGTGFTLAGNATCPTIGVTAWTRTILTANTIVCNVTNSDRLTANTNTTILVENFTAGGTASFQLFNISVRGASGGVYNITGSARPTITVYGNITVTGTNRVNATVVVGTNRITLVSWNFSAIGEATNVSEIVVTLNGTNLAEADIAAVELYNSTDPAAALVNGSFRLIRTNMTPAAPSLTYNFSGINLSVPTGTTGQIVALVVNISGSATGGRTVNGTVIINNNMVTIGSLTGVNAAENFVSMNSNTATIIGNLTIIGASRVAATTGIGTGNVTVISFNFTAAGEQMNITGLNITFNGTHTTADIVRVGLYNSTAAAAGVLDGSGVNYDLIQWNTSAPVNGRYNFSNIVFNVPNGTPNVLLVVINVSSGATGGNTFNASIEGAADVVTTSGTSGQSITETLASQRSGSSSFSGTLSVTGTSRVASYTRLGSSNVTVISFNFSATGEQMNISEIIVTRNGTATNADIVSVALYNSTKANAQTFNETGNIDPLAVNTSAPTNGRYNFSGLSLKIPSSQIIIVVFNISSGATGGNTFNASIEGAADVVTIGSATGAAINETFASQRSGTSTLVALNVTTNTVAAGTVSAGQTLAAMLNITFVALGETINITSVNLTLTGNGTASNITDVRIYRDESTAPGRFDSSDTLLSRGIFNGASIQLNLTPDMYNVSIPIGSTIFFVTYNISSDAVRGSTVGAQLTPSSIAAIGNSSGLAISVTGNSVASTNSTIQLQSNLVVGAITSSVRWITNKTTTVNSTTVTIPVTNAGQSTANLTSVLLTLLDAHTAENASTNFTIVRADSVTSVVGGVTTTLNFTINATTGSQLLRSVNASARVIYNDSNTLVAANNSPVETNTSALFGLDGALPAINIVNPVNFANTTTTIDISFTLNDTGSGINSSTVKFYIGSAPRNATCNPSGLNFTCNFTFSSSDAAYTFNNFVVTVNVSDNATNAAARKEVNFTLNNNDGVESNVTVLIGGVNDGTYPLRWNPLKIPPQFVMEQSGVNATNTGNFNVTAMTASIGATWSHMYYQVNETSYVLATRTDFAGSALKYLNNTGNGLRDYWINMTVKGMVFKI